MPGLYNFVAYLDPATGSSRIGHLDLEAHTIQPLSLVSGTPIDSLYQVIEARPDQIVAVAGAAPSLTATTVTLLPPLAGRDVLAVGKNYAEHAREFNQSGFDSSDTVDRPSHPVIFTKRATSIVAHGAPIEAHDRGFTATLDYEGEIGVIVGKPGRNIALATAWDHVWGFTLINDVTARERQRDHKQFFLGKSADGFCPMGPVAVPKEALPGHGHALLLQTHVNGALRQTATTADLLFSIPDLLHTLSAAQTLQPGDVLATGTPAGVGIGLSPPVFLKPGDEITVSAPGLGTLRNAVVASPLPPVPTPSAFALTNGGRSLGGAAGLTDIGGGKLLHYRRLGTPDASTEPVVFVHGLGGTLDVWTPLTAALHRHPLHVFDLEGHGLSPTHPLHPLTIDSLAADIAGVGRLAGVTPTRPAVLIAHGFGCHAVLRFALSHPTLVRQLVLLGPPPLPPPAGLLARAALVRKHGMGAVVDALVAEGTSAHTQQTTGLAVAAVRLSLLGQDPEAYAKACQGLVGAEALPLKTVAAPTLLIAGADDTVSPPAICEAYSKHIGAHATMVELPQTGHWHMYEDPAGVARAVAAVL